MLSIKERKKKKKDFNTFNAGIYIKPTKWKTSYRKLKVELILPD